MDGTLDSTVKAIVEAAFGALRVSQRPPQVLGVYGFAGSVGYTTVTALAPLVAFRWGDATRFCVPLKIEVGVLATVFTTAGLVERQLMLARSWTVSDTGGTALVLTGNNLKRRTAFPSSLVTDIRFGGPLTAGTRTLDADPHGTVIGWMPAAGTPIPMTPIYDASNGHEHPIIFAQNEGWVIRIGTAGEGASTRRTFVNSVHAEVAAYPY